MNQDQQMVSWLAVFALIIGVFLVYRKQLSTILFSTQGQSFAGPSVIPPSAGNPQGIGTLQPAAAPPGQSGSFRIDQNGDLYKQVGGVWVPWGTTSNPYLPLTTAPGGEI